MNTINDATEFYVSFFKINLNTILTQESTIALSFSVISKVTFQMILTLRNYKISLFMMHSKVRHTFFFFLNVGIR